MEKVLPRNWVECTLNDLAVIQSGGTPSRSNKNYWNGDIPWIKISDIKDLYIDEATEFITKEGLENSAARVFPKGTILFTIFATIGRIGILNIDATTNQAIVGITPTKLINHKYVTYALIDLSNSISEFGKGVAQKNINQAILKDTIIPLPPLSEQNRIVEKLDRLFGQLEVIKISMEKIPFLLKNFRQQVLTQAVTGKLTEEWREGKELEGWKLEKLKNICSRITVGFVGKTVDKYRETGIPFLRSQNIRAFRYDSKNLMFIDSDFHTQIKKSSISADDVAIVRSGYPGTTCVIPKEIKIANCSDILVLTTKPEVLNPHFVAIFMNSQKGKEIVFEGKVGMAQQHFNTKKLQETFLPLPSISEQQEIVSRVESLFAKADAIEEKYKNLKAKIETLPQTILHKAFKGELSEQLETDGDARDLLDEIVALKNGGKAKKAVAKKYVQPDEVLRIVAEADATE